jgi:adenylate cyclase
LRVAKPGAICLSEDAYRQVRGRLDLAISDLGPTQLKNITEPIRVYSLEVGKPAQAKPATAVQAPERPPEPKKRTRLAHAGAGIAALVILAAVGAWHFLGANRSAPVGATRLSIVALPFAQSLRRSGAGYLADALTDN